MRYTVVLNRHGGVARGLDAEALSTEIARALGEAGIEADVRLIEPASLEATLNELARQPDPPDAIVVGGGDGSVSTGGRILVGTEIALGVLPLGTFNLFARAIAMPLALDEALRALAAAHPAHVDTLEVNGRTVLQHASIGMQPHVILARDTVRPPGGRLGKIARGVAAWFEVLKRPPFMDIVLRHDDGETRRRTAGVLVSNDPLREGLGELPVSDDLRKGQVAAYVSRARTRVELVRLALAASLGHWRETGLVEEFIAREIEIAVRAPRLLLSLDGELARLDTPLVCRSRPRSLKVLLPPARTAEQPIAPGSPLA